MEAVTMLSLTIKVPLQSQGHVSCPHVTPTFQLQLCHAHPFSEASVVTGISWCLKVQRMHMCENKRSLKH